MTVLTTDNRRSYTGDGSTTVFAFPVFFLEAADVKVALRVNDVESTPVFNTDYMVSGAGNPSGGTVTFTVAPVSGATVVLFNDPALTQTVDYQDNDEFPAETHERALDKLTLLVQRLSARLARTLQYDETAPTVLTASQVLTRVADAETARDQAQASQVAAATSETNAGNSATAAAGSATAAGSSETNAAASAAAADGSATAAGTSEANAAGSASAASGSATAAGTSETNASGSASAAASSATQAGTSETNAGASATAAAGSATQADTAKVAAEAAQAAAEAASPPFPTSQVTGLDAALAGKAGLADNNTFTATQKANELALTHNTAWNGSTSQNLTVNVNGSNFTVANPTTPVSGAYYALTVTYTTSHTLAWASVFRGVSALALTATAGARDHLVFRYDGTHMQCVGFRANVGAA